MHGDEAVSHGIGSLAERRNHPPRRSTTGSDAARRRGGELSGRGGNEHASQRCRKRQHATSPTRLANVLVTTGRAVEGGALLLQISWRGRVPTGKYVPAGRSGTFRFHPVCGDSWSKPPGVIGLCRTAVRAAKWRGPSQQRDEVLQNCRVPADPSRIPAVWKEEKHSARTSMTTATDPSTSSGPAQQPRRAPDRPLSPSLSSADSRWRRRSCAYPLRPTTCR